MFNSDFKQEVNRAMNFLAEDERTIFVGQSVMYDGAAIYDSLFGIPAYKRLEMPVIEDFQMGFCMGMALQGKIPVCMYPRIDFMVLALNQLVYHLDKASMFGWHPRMIIRTTVGQKQPLDAGPQHTQNHVPALRYMLKNVEITELNDAKGVIFAYTRALRSSRPQLIVENPCM